MDEPSNVSVNVARLRVALGWTQDELAHAAGVSPSTIQKLEQGQNHGSRKIGEIARALGVPAHELHAPPPAGTDAPPPRQDVRPRVTLDRSTAHRPADDDQSAVLAFAIQRYRLDATKAANIRGYLDVRRRTSGPITDAELLSICEKMAGQARVVADRAEDDVIDDEPDAPSLR